MSKEAKEVEINTLPKMVKFLAFSIRVDTFLDDYLSLKKFIKANEEAKDLNTVRDNFATSLLTVSEYIKACYSNTQKPDLRRKEKALYESLVSIASEKTHAEFSPELLLRVIKRRLYTRAKDVGTCERIEHWVFQMKKVRENARLNDRDEPDVPWPSQWFWDTYLHPGKVIFDINEPWERIYNRDLGERLLHHLFSAASYQRPMGGFGRNIKDKIGQLQSLVNQGIIPRKAMAKLLSDRKKEFTLLSSIEALVDDRVPPSWPSKARILLSGSRKLLQLGLINYTQLLELRSDEFLDLMNDTFYPFIVARIITWKQAIAMAENDKHHAIMKDATIRKFVQDDSSLLYRILSLCAQGKSPAQIINTINYDVWAARSVGLIIGTAVAVFLALNWYLIAICAFSTAWMAERIYYSRFCGKDISRYITTADKRWAAAHSSTSSGHTDESDALSRRGGSVIFAPEDDEHDSSLRRSTKDSLGEKLTL